MGRYASLNYTIYIAADPTPVDFDHAAHAWHCIMRPPTLTSRLLQIDKILLKSDSGSRA